MLTKEEFFKKFNVPLKKLPTDEREDILQDFEEHFAIGLEEGKTEEQIAEALGSPVQIAKDLVATYHIEKVEVTATTGNILRAVWAVIGLGFFNLVIVLGPFSALTVMILSGWIASLAFVMSPLLVVANTVLYPDTFQFFDVFISIGMSGVGLLIAIGMFFATKAVTTGFVRYLKYNVRIVKGGMKNA